MNLPIWLGSNVNHYTIYSEMVFPDTVSIEMKTDTAYQRSSALRLSDRNKDFARISWGQWGQVLDLCSYWDSLLHNSYFWILVSSMSELYTFVFFKVPRAVANRRSYSDPFGDGKPWRKLNRTKPPLLQEIFMFRALTQTRLSASRPALVVGPLAKSRGQRNTSSISVRDVLPFSIVNLD